MDPMTKFKDEVTKRGLRGHGLSNAEADSAEQHLMDQMRRNELNFTSQFTSPEELVRSVQKSVLDQNNGAKDRPSGKCATY